MAGPFATPPEKLLLPVEVIGADLFGQQFFERTCTLAILRNGITVSLEQKLGPDSEVILRNPETGEEAIAFVVGHLPEDKTGNAYGLVFLDPTVNPWHIQFPAAESPKTVHLECSGCHTVCALSLSDIELEIFHARKELRRSCGICNSFMAWRETSREITEKRPGGALPSRNPNPGGAASPLEERRRNRRAGMKAVACIRYSGLEVVVACEDISKGGFRFTSRREYLKGTRVEAAAPYTKFSTNIFIPAAIIYSQKIPGGRFRQGVTYIKSRMPIGWNP